MQSLMSYTNAIPDFNPGFTNNAAAQDNGLRLVGLRLGLRHGLYTADLRLAYLGRYQDHDYATRRRLSPSIALGVSSSRVIMW